MKTTTSCHLTFIVLMAFVGSSFAQHHATFAERPAKRQEFVEKMKERALRDKQDSDGSDNYSEYISGHNPTDPNSVFAVTSFTAPASGNVPFIITWDPVAGRIYNVSWSPNLIITPFANISGDIPSPANSYTDTVERINFQNFYRVDVRLVE